jgi:hypothetical protein
LAVAAILEVGTLVVEILEAATRVVGAEIFNESASRLLSRPGFSRGASR